MITVGCMVDSHPEDVAKIWNGPVVKTNSEKTMSFSDIENLFPNFKKSLESIPAQSVLEEKRIIENIILKEDLSTLLKVVHSHARFVPISRVLVKEEVEKLKIY